MKTLRNILAGVGSIFLIVFLFLLSYAFEFVSTSFSMIFKSFNRPVCKRKGHEWINHGGGGFFGPGPLYPFTCERCGKRSRGDMKDFDNKPFTAKLK